MSRENSSASSLVLTVRNSKRLECKQTVACSSLHKLFRKNCFTITKKDQITISSALINKQRRPPVTMAASALIFKGTRRAQIIISKRFAVLPAFFSGNESLEKGEESERKTHPSDVLKSNQIINLLNIQWNGKFGEENLDSARSSHH